VVIGAHLVRLEPDVDRRLLSDDDRRLTDGRSKVDLLLTTLADELGDLLSDVCP